jgi:GNAT superfamily N-acetyltransferase
MIRAARAEDAAAVASLLNALNSLDGPPPERPMTPEVALRDLIGPKARAWLRLAEWSGAVAGFATATPIYDAQRHADALMLLDLYVKPEARRHGLARGLMAALAAHARATGAACLWWGVDAGDDEALLFYRAIGATSDGCFSGEIIADAALECLAREAA